MLSTRARLQARQGRDAPPRHEFLQQLVDEYQRSVHTLRREEIVANLANFAYDPINYASLARLQVMDLFLDLLDSDLRGAEAFAASPPQESAGSSRKRPHPSDQQQQRESTVSNGTRRQQQQLAEFALGGICNCIADPELQRAFIAGDGLALVEPYIWSVEEAHDSITGRRDGVRLRALLSALAIAFFLLDSSAFAEVTSERLRNHIASLELHANSQIANLAAAFRSRFEELLIGAGADVDDAGAELLEMIKLFLLALNALLLVAGVLVACSSAPKRAAPPPSDAANGIKRALLVTAHPDDESMFFLPLVRSLVDAPSEWELHLLCLSRGNFDGLGATRERELHACAAFLGLAAANVRVLEEPALQDGMQTAWDERRVAELVLAYMDERGVSAVFTFDDYGVSGHPNHIAVHHGVKAAIREQHARCEAPGAARTAAAATKVRGWGLESTSLARKYIGVVDAAVSTWTLGANGAFVFLCQPWWNYAAMALHRSQFVWYRRLFVAFSRYTFVNTFRPIGGGDAADGDDDNKKTQ